MEHELNLPGSQILAIFTKIIRKFIVYCKRGNKYCFVGEEIEDAADGSKDDKERNDSSSTEKKRQLQDGTVPPGNAFQLLKQKHEKKLPKHLN